jgi:glutamate synthase domain-containing protein 1/glutamate synthase domain-containing protein 3
MTRADMTRADMIKALAASRRRLAVGLPEALSSPDAEGGCGVIGMAASVPVAGRHLLQALAQMRNRGNGKGGGIAAAGLDPAALGVSREVLAGDYLLSIAYLEPAVRAAVEAGHIRPTFVVDHVHSFTRDADWRDIPGLEVPPPQVVAYFVRVRPEVRERFLRDTPLPVGDDDAIDDEIVYQNSFSLNRAFYASTGDKRAFVLSHGKDLLILKMVGYGEDVVRCYGLEEFPAHVWIGHHRYPTRGRVWHPGGAHPFSGMHEALVHNGDFANYASISSYLAQHGIAPLFLTDTEVAALVFDLLHRTFGYPLELVMEAMAPTTERDLTMLPREKQELYRMLQTVHMHGSPDGPWFFLLAQAEARRRAYRLIGITDTSMLRPQVFALQEGEAAIGLAASEKQGIDAALASLAEVDWRFWPHADRTWNARGGSHTDGGAFVFTADADAGCLTCADKFGRVVSSGAEQAPPPRPAPVVVSTSHALLVADLGPNELAARAAAALAGWSWGDLDGFLAALARSASGDEGRRRALAVLTHLLDRRGPNGSLRPSGLRARVDSSLAAVFAGVRSAPSAGHLWHGHGVPLPDLIAPGVTVVLDAAGYPPEGPDSLGRAVIDVYRRGATHILVAGARGHRFIGAGLGPSSVDLRIDVYGSSGDYLASGLDGAEIVVHGTVQDQAGQIMKDGTLVVHGDVGQTFGYAAKGGRTFILGNAAGRPLINAVGRPRVVINGTCLDYLAESFMAGDPTNGGGFVIVNGIGFDGYGEIRDLDTPYPGGNLFSLASGGAIYLRDPHGAVTDDQLNGGELVDLTDADAAVILPMLAENERLLGIPVTRLLTVGGHEWPLERVYRKVRPLATKALQPEEAWVHKQG